MTKRKLSDLHSTGTDVGTRLIASLQRDPKRA